MTAPVSYEPLDVVEFVRDHVAALAVVEVDEAPYVEVVRRINATTDGDPRGAALLITGLASLAASVLIAAAARGGQSVDDVLDGMALSFMADGHTG